MSNPFRVAHDRSLETASRRSQGLDGSLLHFTDYDGLLGILGSRSLWLSRARSLNDSLEIEHGLTVAARAIADALATEQPPLEKEILREALRNVKTGEREMRTVGLPFIDAHVAAFCQERYRDSLLHWAMYGRKGDGFAIAFDPSLIRSEELKPDLFRVEYDEASQAIEMQTGLEHFLKKARTQEGQAWLEENEVAPGYVGGMCGFTLTALAAAMKHAHFLPEDEWRLVLHRVSTADDDQVRFRLSGRTVTPYHVVPFPVEAVVEVILGSRVNRQRNEVAIEHLLKKGGYKARVTATALSLR